MIYVHELEVYLHMMSETDLMFLDLDSINSVLIIMEMKVFGKIL